MGVDVDSWLHTWYSVACYYTAGNGARGGHSSVEVTWKHKRSLKKNKN